MIRIPPEPVNPLPPPIRPVSNQSSGNSGQLILMMLADMHASRCRMLRVLMAAQNFKGAR